VSQRMQETGSDGVFSCPHCDCFMERGDGVAEELLGIEHVERVELDEDTATVYTDIGEAGSDDVLDVMVKAKAVVGDRDVGHMAA
jgi:hypothetical protein